MQAAKEHLAACQKLCWSFVLHKRLASAELFGLDVDVVGRVTELIYPCGTTASRRLLRRLEAERQPRHESPNLQR